jgi:hypothetical protein
MKNAALLPLLIGLGTAAAQADLLGSFNNGLGKSRPDYDPSELQPTNVNDNGRVAPNSPADSDLGEQSILGTYSGKAPIRFDIGTALFYTDNAPSPNTAITKSSWLWDTRAALSWQPRIASGWFADLGISEEYFLYDKSFATDFAFFELHAGVVKLLPDLDDLLVYGRLEYQQLNPDKFINPQYDATRFRVGAQKVLWSAARQRLSAGASAAFDLFASPATLKRNELALDVSYTYNIADNLTASVMWQGAWWSFDTAGREDWHQLTAAELSWQFHQNARLFTSVSYSRNDSNSPFGANDFKAWQAGLGVGMTVQF